MRAITGTVVFSKPCSLSKAAHILNRFSDSAASHLPSSDCATYLLTAAEATNEHRLFRNGLRANQQQGATNLDAHDYEVPESESKHQDGGWNEVMEVPASASHGSAEEAELAVAAGEKKRKKKEDPHEDKAVAGVASHSPASPEIATEKRKRKGKHSNKEILSDVKLEAGLVVEEELGSEKKKGKRKKVKDHVKLEEDVVYAKEANAQMVNYGVAEQGIAGGEKKRKKKKHAEEEANAKDVKEVKEEMVTNGDLDGEKKRKKKRGRGGDDDNDQGQAEHTKKKQRK